MGKSPVREALLRLAAEDLVESVPQAGYFVKNLTWDDIHEVYMIRCDLECLAVRMACQKGFPELKLLRLEQACQSQHNADLQWDFTKFDIEDLKFHQALISLANSPRLESVIRSSQLQILSWRGNNAASFDQENARCVMDEHLQILQALRARDAQAAESALRNHILVRFESSVADLAHPKTGKKISDAHPVGFLGEDNQ